MESDKIHTSENKEGQPIQKYPYLEVVVSPDANEEVQDLVLKYWDFIDGEFANKPTNLMNESKLSPGKFNFMVRENSKTIFYLGDCLECRQAISYKVTAQSNVKERIEKSPHLCASCLEVFEKSIKELDWKNRKKRKLEHAFKNESWKALQPREMEVLREILRLGNFAAVARKFGAAKTGHFWMTLERLQNMWLIELDRTNFNDKSTEIHFLPELRDRILDGALQEGETRTSLSMNIPNKGVREKSSMPQFSRTIKFGHNILIEQGVEYVCSVWQNRDGSLNFKLTPSSEMPSESQASQSEPRPLQDIVNEVLGDTERRVLGNELNPFDDGK